MKLFAGVTGQLTRHKSDTVIRDASERLEGVDIRHEHHLYMSARPVATALCDYCNIIYACSEMIIYGHWDAWSTGIGS